MVLGSHVIFTAYGFWLPNDPRGSWSDFVGAWELHRFGRATFSGAHVSLADSAHDHEARRDAKGSLRLPPVSFTGLQGRAIGRGFAELVGKSQLTVWTCSIMPEHIHFVVMRHKHPVEQMVTLLKGAATRQLTREGMHPFADKYPERVRPPTPWARGEWKVFLNTVADVERSIQYVEENPVKEGKPPQKWPFVTPFDANALPYWVRRR